MSVWTTQWDSPPFPGSQDAPAEHGLVHILVSVLLKQAFVCSNWKYMHRERGRTPVTMLVWMASGLVLILLLCFWFACSEVLISYTKRTQGFLMTEDMFFSAHEFLKWCFWRNVCCAAVQVGEQGHTALTWWGRAAPPLWGVLSGHCCPREPVWMWHGPRCSFLVIDDR